MIGPSYFGSLPKSKNVYIHDANLTLKGQVNEFQTNQHLGLTLCPTADGNFWVAYEDINTNAQTVFKKIDPNTFTIITQFVASFVAGDRGGKHCLHELPDGNLLTSRRTDHAIVKISKTNGAILATYSLSPNPSDFFLNPDGDKICYVVGNVLKQWNLTGDSALADIKDFGFPIIWPIWLTDNTFIVWKNGNFAYANTDFLRIDSSGTLLQTYTGYTFNPGGIIQAGARAITASVTKNRLWIHGSADFGITSYGQMGDCFSVVVFQLDNGTLLEQIPLGPYGATFPVSDVTDAIRHLPEPAITRIDEDCSLGNLTITGTNLPVPFSATITLNSVVTAYTVVSNTTTQAVVHITNFAAGDYGVTLGS